MSVSKQIVHILLINIILLISVIATARLSLENYEPVDPSQYMIAVDTPTSSTVTKDSFLRVFYGVYVSYLNEILSLGTPVKLFPDWENPYFTASTVEINEAFHMNFWGGMARIPGMNDEGVALIMCHEIGHLVGGEPRFLHPLYRKLSSEGQADYFATSECLKRYFDKDPDILNELNLDHEVFDLNFCKKEFSLDHDLAVCLKSIKGVHGLHAVLSYLKSAEGIARLNRQNSTIVQQTTTNAYPSPQCRIDTLLHGVLGKPRPGCWFHP